MLDNLLNSESTGTRRDFLKVVGLGTSTLILPGCKKKDSTESSQSRTYPFEVSPGLEQIADIDYWHAYGGILSYKGVIHIFGGSDEVANVSPTAAYKTFDPDTLILTSRKEMPEAITSMAYVGFEGGIMTIGGKKYTGPSTRMGVTLDTVFYHNLYENKWTTLNPFPCKIFETDAVLCDGVPYIVGGLLEDEKINFDIFKYDRENDRWQKKTRIPIPVSNRNLSVTAKKEKIYIFGWGAGNVFMLQIYDTQEDKWEKRDMPAEFNEIPSGDCRMHAFVHHDEVNLWAYRTPFLSKNSKGHAIYTSNPQVDTWDKTPLPEISSELGGFAIRTIHGDYGYLCGPEAAYLGNPSYIFRFQLFKKQQSA